MLCLRWLSAVPKQLTSLPWYAVAELVSEKHCRAATIKKPRLALGKNNASLSPLSRFNKHIMKLIVSKLAYWPVWIAIANRKSIVSVPTLVYRLIYYHAMYQYHSIYHAFSTVPLYLPSGFHSNVHTIAWFL